jgi:hypothetical protein
MHGSLPRTGSRVTVRTLCRDTPIPFFYKNNLYTLGTADISKCCARFSQTRIICTLWVPVIFLIVVLVLVEHVISFPLIP